MGLGTDVGPALSCVVLASVTRGSLRLPTCEGREQCPLGRRVMSLGESRHKALTAMQAAALNKIGATRPLLFYPLVLNPSLDFFVSDFSP